jgi:HAE1 family hydrophobic/amphiphilic exporter-1
LPQAWVINQELVDRAELQSLPTWISYERSWETQENADLITAAAQWLVIAVFLIFAILVLQFNSFTRPMVILYSVICALLGVNIGLWLTWNPYSMPMGIGFIALTWIVVNDAIVLLDRIQENVRHGASEFEAIVEAWRSRLQPIILTTLTTLLGILPISLQDEFRAWLWFTLIFGLFAGSAMTLFVIPSLYTIFFVDKNDLKKEI